MKSAIRFAMLALVLVIVAMVSALTAMRFAIHGQEVAVPPLVGVTPAQAERALAALGLQHAGEGVEPLPGLGGIVIAIAATLGECSVGCHVLPPL